MSTLCLSCCCLLSSLARYSSNDLSSLALFSCISRNLSWFLLTKSTLDCHLRSSCISPFSCYYMLSYDGLRASASFSLPSWPRAAARFMLLLCTFMSMQLTSQNLGALKLPCYWPVYVCSTSRIVVYACVNLFLIFCITE